MARTPEEQKAFEQEVDKAARDAEKAVKAAERAMANAPAGTAERLAGKPALLALAAAGGNTALPKPLKAASSDNDFHKRMASVMASLTENKPATQSVAQVDEIGNLIASHEMEESIKAIARAGKKSPEKGQEALMNELNSNPDLAAKFGVRLDKNGKTQSLGNLDLNGGGYSSIEGEAIAKTIAEMTANRNYADIAKSLAGTSFRNEAIGTMNAMNESAHHSDQSTKVAENTCPRVPFRIIPCPKGGNSR